MTDDDKGSLAATGSGTEASAAASKPRFKTNNVNLMFRQTSTELNDGSGSDHDKSSPGPSGSVSSASTAASKSSTGSHRGRFTLAARRDHSIHGSSPSPSLSTASLSSPPPASASTAAAAPQGGNTAANRDTPQEDGANSAVAPAATTGKPPAAAAAPATTTSTTATTPTPTTSSAATLTDPAESAKPLQSAPAPAKRKPSIDYSEEELSNRGISVAGRFHSASNVNWEDEEDDWNPPPMLNGNFPSIVKSSSKASAPLSSTKDVHSTSSSQNSAPISSPGPSTHTTAASKSHATASAAADSAKDSGTPWGHRKVTTTKPLGEAIKEAKEKGTVQLPGLGSGLSRGPISHPGGSGGGGAGGDALSRFRIRSNAGLAGDRGVPPLNPRGHQLDEPLTFQRVSDNSFDRFGDRDMFGRHRSHFPPEDDMFSRSRHPVAGGNLSPPPSVPVSRPIITPRPIPDRFKRGGINPLARPTTSTAAAASPDREPAAAAAAGAEMRPIGRRLSRGEGPATKTEPHEKPAEAVPENVPAEAPANAAPEAVTDSQAEPAARHLDTQRATSVRRRSSVGTDSGAVKPTPAPVVKDPAAILEEQKQEMTSVIAAAKARLEAERAKEEEKERKLKEMREQMRKELEEKEKAEKAKEEARKAELQRKYEAFVERQARVKAEKEAQAKAKQEKERIAREEELKNRRKQLQEEESERSSTGKTGRTTTTTTPTTTTPTAPSFPKGPAEKDQKAEETQTDKSAAVSGGRPASKNARDVQSTYPSRLLLQREKPTRSDTRTLPVGPAKERFSHPRKSNIEVQLPKGSKYSGPITLAMLKDLPSPTPTSKLQSGESEIFDTRLVIKLSQTTQPVVIDVNDKFKSSADTKFGFRSRPRYQNSRPRSDEKSSRPLHPKRTSKFKKSEQSPTD